MNNRHNRATGAIVASGSLLAIIVIGIPWVDDYLRLRQDASEFVDLQSRLVENQTRDLRFSRIESKLEVSHSALSARSIDPSRRNAVRETLVEIVRKAGGRLRRLEIPEGDSRPWALEDDDPRQETTPLYGEESDFVLYTHRVELQADGSLETVREIIRDIADHQWLMSTKSLTASPTGIRESPITLEIQLVLYGLGPNEDKESDEEFDEPEDEFAGRTDRRLR